MTTCKRSLLLLAALSTLSSAAYATSLTAGGTVAAVPVTITGPVSTVDSNASPFTGLDVSSNVIFTGTETTTVVSGDTSNPLGGLTFFYRVISDPTSAHAIDRVTLSGFTGFATDVGFLFSNPALDLPPVVVDRSVNGDVIGFDFSSFNFPNNDITAGSSSAFLVIRTDAPLDAANNMSLIDGGSGSVASFGPAPAPEPASLSLLALGGLALAARRRSR